jgi:predicted GNAT family N-acyltransferase
MDMRFVEHGSHEWLEAREIRYALFFQPHGLAPNIMDDEHEVHASHVAAVNVDTVVGYGRLFKLRQGEFMISQMVVLPVYQRSGIGRMILQTLIRRAVDQGAASIELEARLSAVGFYAKEGFHRCGEVVPSIKTGLPHVRMKSLHHNEIQTDVASLHR